MERARNGPRGRAVQLDGAPDGPERGALWVVVAREVRAAAAHAGIEWLNADEVEARYESSAYGIIEDAAAVAAPVRESYARGIPLMLEGELGAGQDQIAKRLYRMDPMPISPLCPLRSMSLRIAVGAICSKVPNRRYSKRG